ncbi:exportin ellipsoid body open isoform X2 [Haematobia irritans]|uniref:exportin ellipsoid body open isoform X2 n=1 Tax=Haematobia irritans TaxID=7368 RepID=UPI003F4FC362
MTSPLVLVDSLLHEFYQATTPNNRKREIESNLLAFKNQTDAWKTCLTVVSDASTFEQNQFLWFFCTSTLEHSITRRWMQLGSSDRAMMREALWRTYINLPIMSTMKRQRDTYAQLIALMGKREFPDEDPNYIMHCITLIKSNFVLGICLLRTTSEEVVSSREDVSTDRKQYFHSCISLCMPEIMDLLTKYLLIAVCHINDKDVHSISNTLMDYSLISTLPNDNQLSSSVLELLTCIQHLVSWTRTELISEYFLMSILDMSQWRSAHQDLSLAGLSVLNELLYLQKSLPCSVTLMNGVNVLLEQHNTSKQQSEMYIDKFRELLRLYAVKYWQKMLQESSVLEVFLKSLYTCTICENGAYDFTEKLEIWTPIIKGLTMHAKLNRYNDIIHQLVAEIMRRTQFEYNKTELELLDNELMEDNTQTEWQQYLTQCIECIALVAESRPNAVFAQVFSHWSRPHIQLQSLQNDIDCGKTFEVIRKLKSQSFPERLRDFATVCQAVVRVAPLMDTNIMTDASSEVNCHLNVLAENLLSTLKFFTSNKLNTIDVDHSTFQTDYDYLYAQVLMAIRSILPLCQSLKSDHMLLQLFESLGCIFQPNTIMGSSPLIYMAASQLLLCISSVIRPKCLLDIPTIVNLMQSGPRLSHLPRQVIANIYISLISYLVLPWKNVDEQQQDYSRRCQILKEYTGCLAQSFLELDLNSVASAASGEAKVSSISLSLLVTFSLVIEFFKDSSNNTKDMLASTFKPIITKALVIYNAFGQSSNAIAITVAEFSLSVLRTLQNQLGFQFIKEMITLFINVNSREQLTVSRVAVIEKILQMFQLIVQQPGNASLSMLPSILDFTFEHIMPMIQMDNSIADTTDLTSVVYSLFDSILTCKWQYFYKSYVQSNGILQQQNGNTNSTNVSMNPSDNLHPEHFIALMNAYGQILVTGNDPNIVRTVLMSMQSVHEKWRLYQRPLFKENLLGSFLSALINVLISGEGALHFDILASALFAMSQVDALKMRESFANAGLPINMKLIDELCLTTVKNGVRIHKMVQII